MSNSKILIALMMCTVLIVVPLTGYYIYQDINTKIVNTSIRKAELKQQCQATYDERLTEIEKITVVPRPVLPENPSFIELAEYNDYNIKSHKLNDSPENRTKNQEQYNNCIAEVEKIR